MKADTLSLPEDVICDHPESPGQRRQRLAAAKARKSRGETPCPRVVRWITMTLDRRRIPYEASKMYRDEDGRRVIDYALAKSRATVFSDGRMQLTRMMRRMVDAGMAGEAAYARRLDREAAARRRLRLRKLDPPS